MVHFQGQGGGDAPVRGQLLLAVGLGAEGQLAFQFGAGAVGGFNADAGDHLLRGERDAAAVRARHIQGIRQAEQVRFAQGIEAVLKQRENVTGNNVHTLVPPVEIRAQVGGGVQGFTVPAVLQPRGGAAEGVSRHGGVTVGGGDLEGDGVR